MISFTTVPCKQNKQNCREGAMHNCRMSYVVCRITIYTIYHDAFLVLAGRGGDDHDEQVPQGTVDDRRGGAPGRHGREDSGRHPHPWALPVALPEHRTRRAYAVRYGSASPLS